VRCSVLQCVAACCSVLQCVETHKKNNRKERSNVHGVATISRLLKIIGLFCKRAL